MSAVGDNRSIRAELQILVQKGLLTANDAQPLIARYPASDWDVLVLIRWFTILGAVTAGVGGVWLLSTVINGLRLGEAGLLLATGALVWGARYLRQTRRLIKTAAALELLAGFSLQGLTFVLAIDFSSGSGNWPLLVGIQAALLTVFAYALRNRLVLIHAAVCFYTALGANTAYAYGGYWLQMKAPARFLAAGLALLAVSWLHATRLRGALQSFSRVYAHVGLLSVHLALWFFAVFGYFDESSGVSWSDSAGERLMFSVLWAMVSVACLWLAGRLGQRILRGYGLTFLIINAYTFYFQFVVANSAEGWFLHLLITGGSLMFLGVSLERSLRRKDE